MWRDSQTSNVSRETSKRKQRTKNPSKNKFFN